MIVLDANLLLYAYDPAASHHKAARKWVEGAFSGDEIVGIPWQTVGAFLRITTNSKLPGQRVTVERAVEVVDSGWNSLMSGCSRRANVIGRSCAK